MSYENRYWSFEYMAYGYTYDPNTLAAEVMELLKAELPQPIYEEIKEINKPRAPDVVAIGVGYYRPREEIWYN